MAVRGALGADEVAVTKTEAYAKALWRLNLNGMPLEHICEFFEMDENAAIIVIEYGARLIAIEDSRKQLNKLCGRSAYDICEQAGMPYFLNYTGH